MTTSEHLQRIKAKCEQLLELASKRTPGKWAKNTYKPHVAGESVTHSVDGPPSDFMYLQEESDASFIASCAGPAEAGWRATIAAIEWVTQFSQVDLSPCNGGSCAVATEVDERLDSVRHHAVLAILAAWPEELL